MQKGNMMNVTKEQAEMFWTIADNVSAGDVHVSTDDMARCILVAEAMINEAQAEIDRLSTVTADEGVDKQYPLLRYFKYDHLPEHLQVISKPFCVLAYQMAGGSECTTETEAGLRKLLEAKDCAVRAAIK